MLYIYYVKEKNVLTSDDCKFYSLSDYTCPSQYPNSSNLQATV